MSARERLKARLAEIEAGDAGFSASGKALFSPADVRELLDVEALTEREKALMISLWWVVKAAGGRIEVHESVAADMIFGVDMVRQQTNARHDGIVFECVR